MPFRVTFCGLSGALSVMDKVAVRVPACVGVKITLILQLAAGFTEPPHVLVWAKSPASAPVMRMLVMARVAMPKFASVTGLPPLLLPKARGEKSRLVGDNVAFGPETTPVPLKATNCGLPGPS